MIARERLVNKLKEIGYRFKRDAWRVTMFRNGTRRVEVPKRDFLQDETVAQILRQCGLTRDQIVQFIRTCNN
jgi:hypothetical protein